jgi:tRNA-binding EMAP/Myf-like protein
LENQLVIVLCNLKPSKLKGVISEAMILCACSSESTELLTPPNESNIGDRVVVEGCDGAPVAEVNKKNKIFDQIAIDFKTNEMCIATYKQNLLSVPAKGFVRCKSLKNVDIR